MAWSTLNVFTFCFGVILSIAAIFVHETPYSKFGSRVKIDTIPSRQAMLLLYLPSLLVCLFFQQPRFSFDQFNLVHLLTFLHFAKRLLEVSFVHIYKSKTNLETVLSVMSVYTLTTLLDLLVIKNSPVNHFSPVMASIGLSLCLVGETMNGYHHYLLRNLRMLQSVDYQLPHGGFFNWVVAPHYLFEQISYLGLLLISQNIVSLSLKMFPFIYLTFRAKKTKTWYMENLTSEQDRQDAKNRACLIPLVF